MVRASGVCEWWTRRRHTRMFFCGHIRRDACFQAVRLWELSGGSGLVYLNSRLALGVLVWAGERVCYISERKVDDGLRVSPDSTVPLLTHYGRARRS